MKIYRGLENFKKPVKSIITTGTFDGVHKGHVKIINELCSKKKDEESVLITFTPHPRMLLFPDQKLKLLNSFDEKVNLLSSFPIDHLVIQEFNLEFSRRTPLEYIRDYLVKKIGLKKLVIGHDHQFGRNRESSVDLLNEYSELYGFDLIKVPSFSESGVSISSTKIRNYLKTGDIEMANNLLGYSYSIHANVVSGEGIGKSLGYPTANLQVFEKNKLIPSNGVYAVLVYIDNKKYFGMLNIGVKPTFNSSFKKTIELHILNFNKNIYNSEIKIMFFSRLRDEIKFSSKEMLISQLKKDEIRVKNYFYKLSSHRY